MCLYWVLSVKNCEKQHTIWKASWGQRDCLGYQSWRADRGSRHRLAMGCLLCLCFFSTNTSAVQGRRTDRSEQSFQRMDRSERSEKSEECKGRAESQDTMDSQNSPGGQDSKEGEVDKAGDCSGFKEQDDGVNEDTEGDKHKVGLGAEQERLTGHTGPTDGALMMFSETEEGALTIETDWDTIHEAEIDGMLANEDFDDSDLPDAEDPDKLGDPLTVSPPPLPLLPLPRSPCPGTRYDQTP